VVLLCSTIAPEDTARLGRRIDAAGGQTLDAPISGGPARARDGSMSMMIAGPADVRSRIEGLLQALAARRFRISERLGDGARAKLVNNLLAGTHLVAAAEAMTLAARFGLDLDQMADLIGASSGQSWMFDDRIRRALAGDFSARAQAHVITKDLTLAAEAASRAGVAVPLGERARDTMRATCAVGWRYEDDAAVLKYALAQAGLSLPDLKPR
jgi:3-hydroxyisobutyrate dehydrogenase-like beta-hydroxyacid dehydrogenase